LFYHSPWPSFLSSSTFAALTRFARGACSALGAIFVGKFRPSLSPDPMQGDPPCHWANFLSPKLRRFPGSTQQIQWKKHLGHGGEGIVEAVRFGNSGDLLALKMVRAPSTGVLAP
jgi:hypothetical protein